MFAWECVQRAVARRVKTRRLPTPPQHKQKTRRLQPGFRVFTRLDDDVSSLDRDRASCQTLPGWERLPAPVFPSV